LSKFRNIRSALAEDGSVFQLGSHQMPERKITSLNTMQERERKTHSNPLELLVSIAERKGSNDDRHLVPGPL
jgi:hypothetical protein